MRNSVESFNTKGIIFADIIKRQRGLCTVKCFSLRRALRSNLAEPRLLNPRQLLLSLIIVSVLEVGTSSERRARYSPLQDRSAQKFRDLLKYPGCLDGTVISGIYIPCISRIVGNSARDCARFPCYFPSAGERTGGCNPPNPPPGSAPDCRDW